MKTIEILMVEDSPTDVMMTREGLKSSKIANNLNVVKDGEEALSYLRREEQYADVEMPDLIILDLNLPRLSGREVLQDIKQDSVLKHIPVVVLTTSDAEEDILVSYGLYANCYITKPLTFDSFVDVVQSIENFWLTIVKLPPI